MCLGSRKGQSEFGGVSGSRTPISLACGLYAMMFGCLLLTACAETVTKHGHHFQENDLQQIAPGMTEDQVRSTLGTPTTTATVNSGRAYYYISSTTGQTSFFKPVEKDRKVVAIYFGPMGSVDRVANYGLKDGKVFNYAKQQTPTPARDESILKALFRNLGTKQLGIE